MGLETVGQVGEARGGAEGGEVDFGGAGGLLGSGTVALAEGEGEAAAGCGGRLGGGGGGLGCAAEETPS